MNSDSFVERKDCWILSVWPVIYKSYSPNIQRLQQLMGLAANFQVFSPLLSSEYLLWATEWSPDQTEKENCELVWSRGQLPPHKFSSFTDVCAMWSGSISRAPQLFKGNWAYLLQSVSYQNCIEDCLFLFSYYIFMRGYYRVSTSVFISYFRLRKMTSRLGNDDGHRDGD